LELGAAKKVLIDHLTISHMTGSHASGKSILDVKIDSHGRFEMRNSHFHDNRLYETAAVRLTNLIEYFILDQCKFENEVMASRGVYIDIIDVDNVRIMNSVFKSIFKQFSTDFGIFLIKILDLDSN
jgi:hypothetical protein